MPAPRRKPAAKPVEEQATTQVEETPEPFEVPAARAEVAITQKEASPDPAEKLIDAGSIFYGNKLVLEHGTHHPLPEPGLYVNRDALLQKFAEELAAETATEQEPTSFTVHYEEVPSDLPLGELESAMSSAVKQLPVQPAEDVSVLAQTVRAYANTRDVRFELATGVICMFGYGGLLRAVPPNDYRHIATVAEVEAMSDQQIYDAVMA